MRFSSTDLFKYHVINLLNSSCAYKHQHRCKQKEHTLKPEAKPWSQKWLLVFYQCFFFWFSFSSSFKLTQISSTFDQYLGHVLQARSIMLHTVR